MTLTLKDGEVNMIRNMSTGLKLTRSEHRYISKISREKEVTEKEVLLRIIENSFIKPLRKQMNIVSKRLIFSNLNSDDTITKLSMKINASYQETQALYFTLGKYMYTSNLKNKRHSHAITKQSIVKSDNKVKQYSLTSNELTPENIELIKASAMIMNLYETTLITNIVSRWVKTRKLNDEIAPDIKMKLYEMADDKDIPYNEFLNKVLQEGMKTI